MILLIDNYDSFTYNLYQGLATFHSDIKVIRNDKIGIEEIIGLNPAGIVLSPGPGRPDEAGICVELIQTLIKTRSEIPLLGICLGHQALSYALVGKVIQANEIVHGKDDFVFHHRQGLYQKMPLPFLAARYHSLEVDRDTLSPVLLIEAENAQGLIMGMRHKTLPIYGMQFHPESILTINGNVLLEAFVQKCPLSKLGR